MQDGGLVWLSNFSYNPPKEDDITLRNWLDRDTFAAQHRYAPSAPLCDPARYLVAPDDAPLLVLSFRAERPTPPRGHWFGAPALCHLLLAAGTVALAARRWRLVMLAALAGVLLLWRKGRR